VVTRKTSDIKAAGKTEISRQGYPALTGTEENIQEMQ